MTAPLVSCLCVTEGRPAFMPWLLWSYARQSYERRELVVIDSSVPTWRCERDDVRVIAAAPGANVAFKRNRALAEARGEIVAFFDDDDWQHPQRLAQLVQALRGDAPLAAAKRSGFVDVFSGLAKRHAGNRPIFNGAGMRREFARSQRFDARLRLDSDSYWLRGLHVRDPRWVVLESTLSLWLCHVQNLCNSATRVVCTLPLQTLRDDIGAEAWADTDEQLASLRARMPARPRRSEAGCA